MADKVPGNKLKLGPGMICTFLENFNSTADNESM